MVLTLFGCGSNTESNDVPVADTSVPDAYPVKLEARYATGFSVTYYNDYKRVVVYDPWNKGEALVTYLLKEPESVVVPNNNEVVLELPLKSVACQSTTHLPLLNALGLQDAVSGISHPDLVKNEISKALIAAGKIKSIGGSNEIDAEKVIALNPDGLMVYPMEGLNYDNLRESGIKLIYNAEYMEDTPLGQAEWIKFVALFFNKEAAADSVFNAIEQSYNELDALVLQSEKPMVMAGISHAGHYFAPGGNSFNAKFIADAGGDYIWKDLGDKGANQIDMELVVEAGAQADWWVFATAQPYTLEELRAKDDRFSDFSPIADGQVLQCNTEEVNYFEDALLEPHLILADLVHYFNPGALPGHTPKYFKIVE